MYPNARCTRLRVVLCALWGLSTAFDWPGEATRRAADLAEADPRTRRAILEELSVGPRAEVADAVVASLSDADASVRATAARAAGELRLKEASLALVQGLSAEDPAFRAAAARALGEIGDASAVRPLTRALKDKDPTVRVAAVDALGKLGDARATASLLGVLEDPDTGARVHAARALRRVADPSATVALVGKARDPVPEVRVEVVKTLAALEDPRATTAFLQALDDDFPEAALAAVQGLGQVGASDAAFEALQQLLGRADDRMARGALAAMAGFATPKATRRIVSAAREARLRELSPTALQAVLEAASELVPDASRWVSDELDRAHDSDHAQTLVRMASLPTLVRSPELTQSLMRAYEREIVPRDVLLGPLSRSQLPEVRMLLLESTERPGSASPHALLEALERALPDGLGTAVEPLVAWLPRVDARDLASLLRLIARMQAPRAAPAVARYLRHERADVRRSALQALQRLDYREGLEEIQTLFADEDPHVRHAAGRAAGALAPSSVADAWIEQAQSAPPPQQHATLVALAGLLRRHPQVPEKLAKRLERWLANLIESAPSHITATLALDVAAQWADPALVRALAAIDDQHAPIRRLAATRSLAGFDSTEAAKLLRRASESESTLVATTALIEYAPHAVARDVPWLMALVRDAQWPIGPAAAYVIAQLALREDNLQNSGRLLCRLANAREPHTSANGLAALAARPYAPCAERPALFGLRGFPDVRARAGRAWIEGQLKRGQLDASARRRLQSALDEAPEDPLHPTRAGHHDTWTAVQGPDATVQLRHPDALGRLGLPSEARVRLSPPWYAPFLPR